MQPLTHHYSSFFFLFSSFPILDFWTTKCTRCPDALDKLNQMAQDPKYSNVQFISICCDKCDGAREIIEKDTELKWQYMLHYFMEYNDKENMKKILGFKSVPFYVILNEYGIIEQMGNSKSINFNTIPGMIVQEVEKEEQPVVEDDKENAMILDPPMVKKQLEEQTEQVFCMDLDF